MEQRRLDLLQAQQWEDEWRKMLAEQERRQKEEEEEKRLAAEKAEQKANEELIQRMKMMASTNPELLVQVGLQVGFQVHPINISSGHS